MKKGFGRCIYAIVLLMTAVFLSTIYSGNVNAAAKKKTVILYFSATGTTKSVAQKIRKATKGKLIEIEAADPYTDDDLDYSNRRSRVSREHAAAGSPAVSSIRPDIANMKQIKKAVKNADIVYIGYPIWWGEAPHIMYSLVEDVSLKGKTVVPFNTSASSGTGSSSDHLKDHAIISKKTNWKKGKSFYGTSSQKTVNKWVKTIK